MEQDGEMNNVRLGIINTSDTLLDKKQLFVTTLNCHHAVLQAALVQQDVQGDTGGLSRVQGAEVHFADDDADLEVFSDLGTLWQLFHCG